MTEPRDDKVDPGPLAEAAGAGKERPGPREMIEAVLGGIGDTFKDMLHAGQEEAQRAHREAWHRYDDLTRHRRELKKREEEGEE